ncbi:hypothetical protein FACS189428_1690 [Clostridia bacterium]|nr:hypothetical protein FACS189428_1690 [Clostridia bacterium]
MLATGADSQNWNMLDYINAENISLMVDNLAGSPYTGGIVSQGNASFFT